MTKLRFIIGGAVAAVAAVTVAVTSAGASSPSPTYQDYLSNTTGSNCAAWGTHDAGWTCPGQ